MKGSVLMRLLYWIRKSFNKTSDCSKCCLLCKYYHKCKEESGF